MVTVVMTSLLFILARCFLRRVACTESPEYGVNTVSRSQWHVNFPSSWYNYNLHLDATGGSCTGWRRRANCVMG